MFATFLAPLAIASLIGSDLNNKPSAPLLLANAANLIVDSTKSKPAPKADTAKKEEFEIPEEFRTRILTVDILKRLATVKKGLGDLSRKHPQLGGGSLGIAMQSGNYSRFEKSEPFQELLKTNGFTFNDFFHDYNQVVGALFILNVEKQLDQKDLTEAQGFKATKHSKNFVQAQKKLIDELKLGDTYIGTKPVTPSRLGGNNTSENPFEPREPREPTRDPREDFPRDPMNPMGS